MTLPIVTVATTPAQVDALRQRWAQFGATDMDCDIDYFLALVGNGANVIAPYVVHIERDDGNLLLVARLERQWLPLTVGYRKLASFSVTALVVAFGGFVGVRRPVDERVLMHAIGDALAAGRADVAVFQAIDADGTLFNTARQAFGWWRRSHWNAVAPRWKADVSGDAGKFFGKRSAKTRKRYESQDRRLEALYGGRLVLRRETDFADREVLFRDLDHVSAQSYQRRLGAGFKNSKLERALVLYGLSTGAFRAWLLYIDGVPVAHWTGFSHRGTFAIGTPAFNPSHTKDSVGRYTMFRMVEDLCKDPAVQTLDFGFGDAEYKSAFGTAAKVEMRLIVCAGRPRPSLILILHSLANLANHAAKRLLGAMSSGNRLKVLARSRTEAPGPTGGRAGGQTRPEALP